IEKITCVKSRRITRPVEDTLRRGHGHDSTAGLVEHLSCLRAFSPSCPCLQKYLQHLHIVLDAVVQLVEQNPLLGFGVFALADIAQHIDRADCLAGAVAKWGRIWNDGNPGPIGPLRYDFGIADGTPLLKSDCHRTLVIRETGPVWIVKSPGNAPLIASDRR